MPGLRCGGVVSTLDAARHDEIFAAVSHLPHALAFALVAAAGGAHRCDDYLRYAATGFPRFHAACRRRSGDVARRLHRQRDCAPTRAFDLLGPSSTGSMHACARPTAMVWRRFSGRARTRATRGSRAVIGMTTTIDERNAEPAPCSDYLDLQPVSRMTGSVQLPGSKSISNRMLLLAALAHGDTRIEGLLAGR